MRKLFVLSVAMLIGLFLAVPVQANEQATQLVNQLRADNGRGAIRYSTVLENVARDHALDMAGMNRMTHEGPDGSGPGLRATRQGYAWCYVSENVAVGQRSLEEVIEAWANSAGHRKNMLHRKAQEFGIARAKGDYWTMVLAQPGCG